MWKKSENYEFYKIINIEEIPVVDKKAMMSDFYKFNKYKLSKRRNSTNFAWGWKNKKLHT